MLNGLKSKLHFAFQSYFDSEQRERIRDKFVIRFDWIRFDHRNN